MLKLFRRCTILLRIDLLEERYGYYIFNGMRFCIVEYAAIYKSATDSTILNLHRILPYNRQTYLYVLDFIH
jgi:hypothetical protein